jgi:hypothetical protein
MISFERGCGQDRIGKKEERPGSLRGRVFGIGKVGVVVDLQMSLDVHGLSEGTLLGCVATDGLTDNKRGVALRNQVGTSDKAIQAARQERDAILFWPVRRMIGNGNDPAANEVKLPSVCRQEAEKLSDEAFLRIPEIRLGDADLKIKFPTPAIWADVAMAGQVGGIRG